MPVYETFAPRTLLGESYVNHAHNDWLELWLTGGIPAILLAFAFLAWLAASTVRLWRSDEPQGSVLDLALARAAPIVIVIATVTFGGGLSIADPRTLGLVCNCMCLFDLSAN